MGQRHSLPPTSSDDEILRALQEPNRIIIDCRSESEYALGERFYGALNIPVDSLKDKVNEIGPKDRPIIIYCAVGVRSCRGAKILIEAGFTNVHSTTNARHLRDIPASHSSIKD